MSEYALRFSELSWHSPTLVSIVRERIYRFIEGLSPGIIFSMAQELDTDTLFQEIVDIARRLEHIWGKDREDMEAKMPRNCRGYSGARAPNGARHDRGYVSLLVHSTLPATSNSLDIS